MEHLDKLQRLNLINQYSILLEFAIMKNDKYMAEKYKQYIEILEYGYTREYYTFFDDLHDELTKEESDLVWDILQIYSIIQSSYKKVRTPKINEDDIRFDGFDGNYETYYYAYCKFILFDLKRFCELTDGDRRDFNSHARRCEKYKKMQEIWYSLNKPFDLGENEMLLLLSI